MSDLSLRVFDSVLDMLSNENNPTPIVRLNRVTPFKHTTVSAKLEWYNPFGAGSCGAGGVTMLPLLLAGFGFMKRKPGLTRP